MSQFEYLAIAFSLLYSLAALRIIAGLPAAIAPGRRSWLHLTLTGTTLFLIAVSFWVFYSLSAATWSFTGFLVALMIPSTLYFCAATAVPTSPESVESWHAHYRAIRQRWFLGLAAWAVGAATSATINLDMGITHPARAIHVGALVIGLVGATSSSDRLHRVLAGILLSMTVATIGAQIGPDWLVTG